MIQRRGEHFQALIAQELWDQEQGIFVNRFRNGSFTDRVSPTSFYALGARAASDEQAAMMVQGWLVNHTRFCIAPEGDFKGNTDSCYWGLPSIQASDRAFPSLGYWRGYVWGPMAMLTYWSLDEYRHVPAVAKGKAALVKQMRQLMLSQWRAHAHICENFNPHRSADTSGGDCSGTTFYHWGALTGLLSAFEARLF